MSLQSLCHNGPYFQEYIVHGIKPIFRGKKIKVNLENELEEMITAYARLVGSKSLVLEKETFQNNFLNELKQFKTFQTIKSLQELDISPILIYLKSKKSKTSKNVNLDDQDSDMDINQIYGFATIDGKKVKIANWKMEPPTIFIGRGDHPLTGKWKSRIYPKDVTINIAPKCKTIKYDLEWQSKIWEPNADYLASWKDKLTRKIKYMRLANDSDLKQESDKTKFEIARQLCKNYDKVYEYYKNDLDADSLIIKQIATAIWILDHFCIRIGNEKSRSNLDSKSQSVVGCCTLKVENVYLTEPNKLKLQFIGKDSIPFENEMVVNEMVYVNIKNFIKDKSDKDYVFELIDSIDVNEYLKHILPNLSAKVFRTMRSSKLFEQELKKIEPKTIEEAKQIFENANRKVAILCNHQKQPTRLNLENMTKLEKRFACWRNEHKKRMDQKSFKNLKKTEKQLENKKKNFGIAMGTSKQNYIDPRITIAWAKKFNIPIQKLFSKSLIQRFSWAASTSRDFKF